MKNAICYTTGMGFRILSPCKAKQRDQWHFFWQKAPCCRGHNTRTKRPGLLLKLF